MRNKESPSSALLSNKEKILIIRLSSIGDVVLTTPVVRSLKNARPAVQIHYLVKEKFRQAIELNPYIDKLHIFKGSLNETLRELQAEKFDFVLDLHNNLRSIYWRLRLGVPFSVFDKKNAAKWRMTTFKEKLEIPHVVHRYGQTLSPLCVALDNEGLDFPVPEAVLAQAAAHLREAFAAPPYALALGATFATKQWTAENCIGFVNLFNQPVVLLGGKTETALAEQIAQHLRVPFLNLAGKTNLIESAAYLDGCRMVVTNDTGLMHIAAARRKPILAVWGNTTPSLGMTPYHAPFLSAEAANVDCRPCSKLGYNACPKGHFRCMKDNSPENAAALAQKLLST